MPVLISLIVPPSLGLAITRPLDFEPPRVSGAGRGRSAPGARPAEGRDRRRERSARNRCQASSLSQTAMIRKPSSVGPAMCRTSPPGAGRQVPPRSVRSAPSSRRRLARRRTPSLLLPCTTRHDRGPPFRYSGAFTEPRRATMRPCGRDSCPRTARARRRAGPLPRAPKERRLLAALVAAEARPAERCSDAVWAESPPLSAPKLLQVYVSKLRKAPPS